MYLLALNILVNSTDLCTNCEYFIDFIRYEVDLGNKTIEDITILLRNICSKIIGPGAHECIDIANDIENISEMIAYGMNNTNICENLHFCNKSLLL